MPDDELTMLSGLDCDFLGLNCYPKLLKVVLHSGQHSGTLNVLYIRGSGRFIKEAGGFAIAFDFPAVPVSLNNTDPYGFLSSNDPQWNERIRMQYYILSTFEGIEVPRPTPELYGFMQWAFGRDGISSLQIIARDFSYGGRFSRTEMLFCRYTFPEDSILAESGLPLYRPVRAEDTELWDLRDENRGNLEACPAEALLDH